VSRGIECNSCAETSSRDDKAGRQGGINRTARSHWVLRRCLDSLCPKRVSDQIDYHTSEGRTSDGFA